MHILHSVVCWSLPTYGKGTSMKKAMMVLVVLGIMGCGAVSSAAKYDSEGLRVVSAETPTSCAAEALPAMGDMLRLHIGAGISGVWPEDGDYINNTYMIDITGQLDLALGISAEVSLGWATYDYDDGGYQGEISMMPLFASAFYSIGAGNIKGYFGGGLQWEIADAGDISGLDVNDPLGFHAAAGVSLSQGRFSVQAEARYTFSDIEVDFTDPMEPDFTFNGDALNARIKFLLNF